MKKSFSNHKGEKIKKEARRLLFWV